MSIDIFPASSPQRIKLPLPPPAQLPSWRVLFSRETVEVATANSAQGADSEGYFPVNAAYLEAQGCRPGLCLDATVFQDDGLSRCALYLNEGVVTPNEPNEVATPQLVLYKIKVSIEGIGATLFKGGFLVGFQSNIGIPKRGFIAEVSGVLGTQFEVWAKVSDGLSAQPVKVRFQMILDRLGSAPFAYPGIPAGGDVLPLPCCTGATGAT